MSSLTESLRLVISGDSSGARKALHSFGEEVGKSDKKTTGLAASFDKFKGGFSKIRDGLKQVLQGDLGKGLTTAKQGVGDLATGFSSLGGKGLAAVAGIAAAAGAIVGLALAAKKAIGALMQVGGELAGLGRLTGLESEGLTGLYGQFRMTGTDATAAGTAVGRFSKALKDARADGKSLDLFKELGVDVKDANGKLIDGNVVLAKTRTALSKVGDTYTRNADAQALFGRGFKTLGKWMTASEGDIKRYNKIISESGFKWGPDQKKGYSQFVMAQREMSLRWQLMWATIGQKMLPLLNKILTRYIAPVFNRFAKFLGLLDLIPGKSAAISQAFNTMFGPIFGALQAVGQIIDALDAIKKGTPAAKGAVLGSLNTLYSTIPGFSLLKNLSPVPGMAGGGYIPRTPGGTLLRVGEGRHDEIVAQVLPGRGARSSTVPVVNLHFHGPVVGGKAGMREFSDIVKRDVMAGAQRAMVGQNA